MSDSIEHEPCPPGLDEDGQQLWAMCNWVLLSGAVNPSVAIQMQALAIRRELRLESVNAELLMACQAFIEWDDSQRSLDVPNAISAQMAAAVAKAKVVQ